MRGSIFVVVKLCILGAEIMGQAPRVSRQARPILGSTARVSLVPQPTTMSFVSAGWSDVSAPGGLNLPYPLVTFGMPGCFLRTSADLGNLPFDQGSLSGTDIEFYLTFPNVPWLLGVEFYLQGLALAPGSVLVWAPARVLVVVHVWS